MQLLDVQLNQFHCYVVMCYGAIETHSQLEVIVSCLVDGFGEIWRIAVLFRYSGYTYPDSQK